MYDCAGQDCSMSAALPPWTRGIGIPIGVCTFLGHVTRADKIDEFTIEPESGTQLGVTEAQGTGGDAVEHWLKISRGPRDDAQNLAGRRLPIESLLRLVQQPDILDGDDGLVGECLEQGDLLVPERSDLGF